MKVKVSYAIDLSEVPDTIKKLVNRNTEILLDLVRISEDLSVGDYGIASHKKLETLVEKTETLSESYADCVSILSGFLQAMVPAISPEEVDELQEKVSRLKQTSEENEENVKT